MNKLKHFTVALLAITLYACQQEDIAPDTDSKVQVIGGDETAPVTLSGNISYNTGYAAEGENENGLRSVNYAVEMEDYDWSFPVPFVEGQTTTLTCIIKSDDNTKPTTIIDIDWVNTGRQSVYLNHKAITLANGTDLTQGNWYIMALYTSNGGATGQTFSLDKNTGKLTISAPASESVAGQYADVIRNPYLSSSYTYSSVPAFLASPWQKLTVEVIDGNTAAKINNTLVLKPQGSMIVLIDEYGMPGMDKLTPLLGDLNTRYYAPDFTHKDTDEFAWEDTRLGENRYQTYADWYKAVGSSGPVNDTKGFTWSELMDINGYIIEASRSTFQYRPALMDVAGVYELLPAGIAPQEGAYTMTFTPNTTVPVPTQVGTDVGGNTLFTYEDVWNTLHFDNPSPATHRYSNTTTEAKRYIRYLWIKSRLTRSQDGAGVFHTSKATPGLKTTLKWSGNETDKTRVQGDYELLAMYPPEFYIHTYVTPTGYSRYSLPWTWKEEFRSSFHVDLGYQKFCHDRGYFTKPILSMGMIPKEGYAFPMKRIYKITLSPTIRGVHEDYRVELIQDL